MKSHGVKYSQYIKRQRGGRGQRRKERKERELPKKPYVRKDMHSYVCECKKVYILIKVYSIKDPFQPISPISFTQGISLSDIR